MAYSSVSRFPRRGPSRSIGWIAARLAWAVMTFLVMASPGMVGRAAAEESDAIPIKIRFDQGASSKDISGAVIRGERSLYSIDARSGQRLSLNISSVEDNAVFEVYQPGARVVGGKPLAADTNSWSDMLPVTGTYLVVVGPTRGNATYTLRVTIR
jgi:hypothetical protein